MKLSSTNKVKILSAVLAVIAVGLIIAGFLVPPMGVIDGSVLQAVGEIIALISIFFAWESVDRGIDAKFTHGSTTVEIQNPDNKDEDI